VRRQRRPRGQDVLQRELTGPVEHHAEAAALAVLDEVDDGAAEVRVEQPGRRHEERPRANPGCGAVVHHRVIVASALP
jgi:hypothetical protein